MFDIGFWELSLIGVVALLVVGPERLPALARTVGLYAGKMRRWVTQVRGEVERELRAEEIRQAMRDAEKSEALRGVSDAVRMDDVKDAFRTAGSAIKEARDAAEDGSAAKTAEVGPAAVGQQDTTTPAAAGDGSAAKTAAEGRAAAGTDPGPAAVGQQDTTTPAAAGDPAPAGDAQTSTADRKGGRERGTG